MKNTRFGKMHVFFSSLLILMIHLPFSFAKPKDNDSKPGSTKTLATERLMADAAVSLKAERLVIYDSLGLDMLGLSYKAYDYAIQGLEKLKAAGKITNDGLISIVDFTKSSAEKRLFVI